jgi:beta-glucosidase
VANVTMHDLYDAYLPQFRVQVQEGNVSEVMCAYSGTNYSSNAPDCASDFLITTTLRGVLGFDGHVISDNGAVAMVTQTHHWVPTLEDAAAVCLNAGCDNDLGYDAVYPDYLGQALADGLVNMSAITTAVVRGMTLRMKLGEFDPAWMVPYNAYGADV